jgi:hypothetical protein
MSCSDCNRGSILEGKPMDSFTEINGVKAYLTSTGDVNARKDGRAIILLSDGFGLPLVNSHLLADKFSKELSCDVWIPDLFDGTQFYLECRDFTDRMHQGQPLLDLNGMAEDVLPKRPRTWLLWDKIKFVIVILLLRSWIFFRNRALVVDPRTTAVRMFSVFADRAVLILCSSSRGFANSGNTIKWVLSGKCLLILNKASRVTPETAKILFWRISWCEIGLARCL